LTNTDQDTLNVNAGSFVFNTDANTGTANLAINVGAAGAVTFNATQHVQSLTLTGGTATLAKNGSLAIEVGSIAANQGGRLDLADNALVARAMTPTAVQALLAAGYNGGSWNGGNGITSSAAAGDSAGLMALGYATNADLRLSSFRGITGLAPSDVLVRYTYYGDADLDGQVTLDDFSQFLNGYQKQSPATNNWLSGDFDYSGAITLDDFSQFLFGYQHQGGALASGDERWSVR
jgi:hypothetical protein